MYISVFRIKQTFVAVSLKQIFFYDESRFYFLAGDKEENEERHIGSSVTIRCENKKGYENYLCNKVNAKFDCDTLNQPTSGEDLQTNDDKFHSLTIDSLTLQDEDVYFCIYKDPIMKHVKCSKKVHLRISSKQ